MDVCLSERIHPLIVPSGEQGLFFKIVTFFFVGSSGQSF
jgi:hypothetical protein